MPTIRTDDYPWPDGAARHNPGPSDRQFLEELAARLDEFITVTRKQLDHLDEMTHETGQRVEAIGAFIEEHRPALARGLALMGGGLGAWRKGRRDGGT